ncbi:hypothetical protein ACFW9O_15275 [Streptomyces sp. NPDC059499]|uniref:hypothetical protein n=1 Tax=Streptomyces sp. NPDC059499 TaxID=3346852 RepID=UPI003681D485
MTRTDDVTGGRARLAVVFGGASVACWFCCPFWMMVWAFALPMGLTGVVRGFIEWRAASREGVGRAEPLIGLALATVGTAAAVAYMIFVFTHPDLPIQG